MAKYEIETDDGPQTRERQEWKRIQIDIPVQSLTIPTTTQPEPYERNLADFLQIKGMFRHRSDSSVLFTLSLLNLHVNSTESRIGAADCFFQVSVKIASAHGRPVFREYKVLPERDSSQSDDPDVHEEAALELLYRKRKAFAVGHGCSVDWGEESEGKVSQLSTCIIPRVKVPPVEPRSTGGDELSMYFLSGAEGTVAEEKIPKTLEQLAQDYETWIAKREKEISGLDERLQKAASANLTQCRKCLSRVREGISLLTRDSQLLEAFMLANRAILMQQHHSRRPKRPTNVGMEELPSSYKPTEPHQGRWRTFQLAFILIEPFIIEDSRRWKRSPGT